MFVNTLSAAGNYPVKCRGNLELRSQMQLCEKRKNSSGFFVSFLQTTSNLKHLEAKMMVVANVFAKFQTVKNFVTGLCKKRRFGTRLNSRYVKVSQILVKSP